jgi:hypothetical protein
MDLDNVVAMLAMWDERNCKVARVQTMADMSAFICEFGFWQLMLLIGQVQEECRVVHKVHQSTDKVLHMQALKIQELEEQLCDRSSRSSAIFDFPHNLTHF